MVRRSWEIAASMRVRSSTKRRRRSCMRLKARVARRSSREPASGRAGARTSTPRRSAASAKRVRGLVTRRAAQIAKIRMKVPVSTIQAPVTTAQRSEVMSAETRNTNQPPSAWATEMAIFWRLGSRSGTWGASPWVKIGGGWRQRPQAWTSTLRSPRAPRYLATSWRTSSAWRQSPWSGRGGASAKRTQRVGLLMARSNAARSPAGVVSISSVMATIRSAAERAKTLTVA